MRYLHNILYIYNLDERPFFPTVVLMEEKHAQSSIEEGPTEPHLAWTHHSQFSGRDIILNTPTLGIVK